MTRPPRVDRWSRLFILAPNANFCQYCVCTHHGTSETQLILGQDTAETHSAHDQTCSLSPGLCPGSGSGPYQAQFPFWDSPEDLLLVPEHTPEHRPRWLAGMTESKLPSIQQSSIPGSSRPLLPFGHSGVTWPRYRGPQRWPLHHHAAPGSGPKKCLHENGSLVFSGLEKVKQSQDSL